MTIAIAAALGLVAGAVVGFGAAIATLALRGWANARLVARGEPARRNEALPLPYMLLAALIAAPLAAVLAVWLPLASSVALAAAAPAGLFIAVTIVAMLLSGS